MDFAKFTSLLQNESLYFPSLNQFDLTDPWEGFPSKINFHPDRPIQVQENNPDGTTNRIYITTQSQMHGDNFNQYIESFKQGYARLRKVFYVSCWHMNDDESDSQWRIYGDNALSLAIVSNFQRVREAILDPRKIYGANVLYYHPDEDVVPEGNAFYPVTYKRQAFSHEREFRLIGWEPSLMDAKNAPSGLSVNVDLEKLIERVVISPRAPTWFINVVTSLIEKYGFNFLHSKSDLLEPFS